MTLVLNAPVQLEDLITYTQGVPLPSNTQLLQSFPRRDYDFDEIDFATITQTNRLAQFRNWDGNFWVAPRDTGLIKKVKMLPLGSQSSGIGEYERRQIEYKRMGGTVQSVLVDAIYADVDHQTAYTYNRLEMAWGDVLTDGVLTISENGVSQQLDYGIASSQKVTAGTLWSDTANSDPLADLIAWYDVYRAVNGAGPGQFKCSLTTARQLQANVKLINAIKGAQTGVTNVTLAEISGLFASYGLPPISMDSVYDSFFQDDSGTTVRPIPANKFMFLPANLGDLGFTAWGIPTTVLEMIDVMQQTEVAPGVVAMIVKASQPPYQQKVFVDAVALPVLADPRKILVATVA
jgi:hypothetical protein